MKTLYVLILESKLGLEESHLMGVLSGADALHRGSVPGVCI